MVAYKSKVLWYRLRMVVVPCQSQNLEKDAKLDCSDSHDDGLQQPYGAVRARGLIKLYYFSVSSSSNSHDDGLQQPYGAVQARGLIKLYYFSVSSSFFTFPS